MHYFKLAATFDPAAFPQDMIAPVIKEMCQSYENRNEHARNAKDSCHFVRGNSTVENEVAV